MFEMLVQNDKCVVIMARLKYYFDSGSLPNAGDLKGQALYWKTAYNAGGKGTEQQYIDRWNSFMNH